MSGHPGPSITATSWSGAPLVGRESLLDQLERVTQAAATGHGSIVLVTGEAGIGKTSVVRHLARHAAPDIDVTWGRCLADGSAPPFWPWRTLLGATPSLEVTTLEVTRSVAPSVPGADRFEMLAAERQRLVERARQRPLMHVIEDVQWADVASLLLLAHAGEAISGEAALIVATLRTGEPLGQQLSDAIESVRRLAFVVEVPPLGPDAIAQLVRQAGVAADPVLTSMLGERTGGNPLYVTELLRAAPVDKPAEQLRRSLAGNVPDRVAGLVADRLARLPSAVADTVAMASVLGHEGDLRQLAAATHSAVEVTLDLVEQARAARLLDAAPAGRWQFVHAVVGDAVYRSVPAATRTQHHAAALAALRASRTAQPSLLARHAIAAQPLVDADQAVEWATAAGTMALAHHAYEEAIAWIDQALVVSTSSGGNLRPDLLVRRGEAHRHIGETELARAAFLAAADLSDDPSTLARAALGYADPGADLGIAYRTDDPVTGTLLRRAIDSQPPDDSVTTVLLEARLAAELYFSENRIGARALAATAISRATRLGDLGVLCTATAVQHDAFEVGQATLAEQLAVSEQMLAWARASGSTAALLTAHRARVFDLLAAGELAAVDAEILAFRRVAAPLDSPGFEWWLALWAAMRAMLDGRHEAAEAKAIEAFQIGQQPFPTLAMVNLSFLLFFLRREQGRLDELEPMVREYAATQADIPSIRIALAFLLAELGRLDEARGLLATLAERGFGELHDRNWAASWFQLARTAALVDDREVARQLLDARHVPSERCVMVSLATACLGAADLATAWLLHTVGDVEAAVDRYMRAAELNARIGARSWLAQTRIDHARLLVARDQPGDREAAETLIRLAQHTAAELQLEPVVRAAALLAASPDMHAEQGIACLRRDGGWWTVEFGGRSAHVAHARGLTDIAVLLARPGQSLSVLELVGEPGSVTDRAGGVSTFDDRARREIRRRLQELDSEIDDAEAAGDGERAAIAREQRQLLAERVARDFGLGGRPRQLGDPVERARKTVSTRIRRAIAAVARVHPELGRHLERSIDTGAWCAYRPAEPIIWRT